MKAEKKQQQQRRRQRHHGDGNGNGNDHEDSAAANTSTASNNTSTSNPPDNAAARGNDEGEKNVRFASMDAVQNFLARLVSAGFSRSGSGSSEDNSNNDAGGTDHNDIIEQQIQSSKQQQLGAGGGDDVPSIPSTRSIFVDEDLAADLHHHSRRRSSPSTAAATAATTATAKSAATTTTSTDATRNNAKVKASSPLAGHANSVIVWRNLNKSVGHNRHKTMMTKKKKKKDEERTPASRLPLRYCKLVSTMLVLTAVATEFIGISISLPVLISYATSFGIPERLSGLVFSVSGFSTFLSNLWIPIRSDTIGRKPIIVATLLGSFVAYVMEASAPSFEVLLLGLFMGGFFGGTQPVAVAYISDIYSPAERPRFIGMVPACASVCFTMGPALGGFLSSATGSYRAPLIFASVVVAAFLPVIMYYLPESRDILSKAEREEIRLLESQEPEMKEGTMTYERRTTYASSSISPATFLSETSPLVRTATKKEYAGPIRDIRCYGCLFIELLRTLAFSGFVTTLPLVLGDPTFGLTSNQSIVMWTGIVIGLSSAVKSIGLFVLFDRIQKQIGLVETMVLGSMCGCGAFFMLMFSGRQSIALLAVGFSLFCFGSAMVQPGVFAFVTLIVPHAHVARGVAMPNFATSLGQTIAPLCGSAILANTNYRVLFFIGLILMATQLLLSMAFLVKRRSTEEEEEEKEEEEGLGFKKTVLTDIEEEEEENEEEEEEGEDDIEEAIPFDEYHDLLQSTLFQLLEEKNYDLRNAKAQKIVLSILNTSFPYLRDNADDRDRDLDKLCSELSILRGRKAKKEGGRVQQQQLNQSVLRTSVAGSTAW
mmetsp:Transcript_31627/g.68400  ORF Transcript_31627/g.68400 Transcript_31627/m.68400 type:complete len:826 (-) Transcript_31627:66-2543(-)